mmetsp:Transcript_69612/g.213427  ORF Transcript_69612/g.213427 Transcript_69612/m.213427 type:complete len:218 (+) Transcript_69612:1044-1697(+)
MPILHNAADKSRSWTTQSRGTTCSGSWTASASLFERLNRNTTVWPSSCMPRTSATWTEADFMPSSTKCERTIDPVDSDRTIDSVEKSPKLVLSPVLATASRTWEKSSATPPTRPTKAPNASKLITPSLSGSASRRTSFAVSGPNPTYVTKWLNSSTSKAPERSKSNFWNTSAKLLLSASMAAWIRPRCAAASPTRPATRQRWHRSSQWCMGCTFRAR